MRTIRALDRMQQCFEKEVGKTALSETLKVLRSLEAIASLQRELATA